jgi:photosystem II stability/assembly factor-like uncharacterized protein
MFKKLVFISLCLIFALQASIAQNIDIEDLKGINVRNVGPAGMSGRVTCIDVVLDNPDHIYVGTASGGVWESKNGGINWAPIFDKEDLQAIGSIAINQQNPNEIWVGTGEGNPRNSMNTGKGIYKSNDGGKTWNLMGLESTRTIHRIIIHPQDPNVVIIGALGSIWGENPERGIFRTEDGGKTWEKTLFVDNGTGCADLVLDPNNPNKLIAGMWTFGRKPWTFNSGGEGSGLYISYDAGKTWKRKTSEDGLPKGDLGRIGLSFAPSKKNLVYALVEAKTNGLYKSDDGGSSWSLVSDENIGNRPFYYSDIFVDPSNENRIFNLHSTVTLSEDGGRTFKQLLGYVGFNGVHPDHHAFWIHPTNPDYVIEGNDGGLNISRDRGQTWQFINNLPVGQFYHVNYDMAIPYNIMGGMQDNGSWVGPSSTWKRGGIRNSDWQEVFFGDGFDVVPHPSNPDLVYAMSQGGNVARINKVTGKSNYIKPVHPEGIDLRFNWDAAIAQDPNNDCGLYFGSQFVHYSSDCGNSWSIISPDLTTNDSLKQLQHLSGGLTIDDTQAENHTTIIAIEPSSVDKNVIWVGTDDGNLQLTTDGGSSWNNLSDKLPEFEEGSWIPQIFASLTNAGEAFIVVNDYRRNNWNSYLYHTKDFGKKFTRIIDNNDVDGYVQSFVQDPTEENLLFAGTDYGLYFSIDKGDNWTKWTNDYPSVPTRDLKIHPREHDLIIGTFGRSLWVMDDITPFRALAASNGKVLESPIHAFQAKHAYLVEGMRSVDGARFIADAEFDAPNKRYSPNMRLWIQPDSVAEKSKAKIKIEIKNTDGEIIRTYTRKAKKGMNNISWNMSMDGVRYISRRPVKKDSDIPAGMRVAPGNYEVVFSYKDMKDSTSLELLADPRYTFNAEAHARQIAYGRSVENTIDLGFRAFEQLKASKKAMKNVKSMYYQFDKETKSTLDSLSKDMKKELAEIELLFMQKEGLKGIQRENNNISGYAWMTISYMEDSDWSIGASQMTELMYGKLKDSVNEAVTRINAFYEGPWSNYMEQVENAPKSIFEDREELK